VASAAQFCSAYLSSIMYMELLCNTENRYLNTLSFSCKDFKAPFCPLQSTSYFFRHVDFDGTSIAYVDYVCEIEPEEGKMLQNLLLKVLFWKIFLVVFGSIYMYFFFICDRHTSKLVTKMLCMVVVHQCFLILIVESLNMNI